MAMGPKSREIARFAISLRGANHTHSNIGYQASMKFVETKPFADPEVAARKLLELANPFEPIQDGRIYI